MIQSPLSSAEIKTLSDCIKMLEDKGYTTPFLVSQEGLKSVASNSTYNSNQVRIVDLFRFEGNFDLENNSILYAIESIIGEHGLLLDDYGSNGDKHF